MSVQIIRILLDYHVASIYTTAVSCSVGTSSSESLPNDGEKPNQPKRFLFLKSDCGKIFVKCAF